MKPVNWRLVDNDPALLAEANVRHGKSFMLETHVLNLGDIARLPIRDTSLVTASALFDLVSPEFINALAAALRGPGEPRTGLYSALNYDGSMDWTPVHAMDEAVLIAFNQDQLRDKGMGPALGPAAGTYTRQVFSRSGFQVRLAHSPWRLDGSDSNLASALVSGIGEAVGNTRAVDPALLQDWVQFRNAHVKSGTCNVGHVDVLALPPGA